MEPSRNKFRRAEVFEVGPGDFNITSGKQQSTRKESTKQHSLLWVVLALVLIAIAIQFAVAQLNVTRAQTNTHINAISAGVVSAQQAPCPHGTGPPNPHFPPPCTFTLPLWPLH